MRPRRVMLAVGILSWLGGWGSAARACNYELKATHLLQCRPIALLEGPEGQPAWTYVDDRPNNDKILAHILCTCDTALATPDAACEAEQTHKLTFTQETSDILKTCTTQTSLCQEPCKALLAHQSL